MSVFFPRIAFTPVRCAAPTFRQEIAPLWSLFDDATRQLQHIERHTRRAQPFNPKFDLKEDKEFYILEGEVPGFKDSDLSIEWKDDVLAIRGRTESVVEKGKQPEKAAVAESATPAESETSSVKSHQATVEDDTEEPANKSAVTDEKSQETPAQTEAPVQQQEQQPQQPQVQHWISERRTGQFLRQFAFPSNAVNHEAIKASLQSGILKIVVPKAPVPESRRINIE